MKRIAIFLDGTWNQGDDNTNVWRTHAILAEKGADGCKQIARYDVGVNGFFGGTFGKGLVDNVLESYEWLISKHDDGDEIFIFGFSRGAYTARSLAGLIAKYGLLKPGSPISTRQILARYQRPEEETIWNLLDAAAEQERLSQGAMISTEESLLKKYSKRVPIKMVGVWDTVGALGLPFFGIEGISRSTLNWLHTGLRRSIEHGFHALAIDEHRKSFAPTLWSARRGIMAAPRSLSSVEQRWFAGAHGNVGGGYELDFLAQPPLRWMLQKASGLGLCFRSQVELDGDIITAHVTDSYRPFMKGTYRAFVKPFHRVIGAQPYTDAAGHEHCTINETIDESVFERWRLRDDYRPVSLQRWAETYKVEIAETIGTVAIDGTPLLVSK